MCMLAGMKQYTVYVSWYEAMLAGMKKTQGKVCGGIGTGNGIQSDLYVMARLEPGCM